jgi:hypothetical protein
MSELKVNTISGIAGSVRVNDPVGIGAVAKSGYDLNVDGKVNLEGSVEVITVPASNFGVRIRAPQTATTSPGFGDATLQFTNYAGTTEWASMHAKTDSSLQIRTNNAPALNISSAQVIDHIGQSLFTNKATFNNATQFNGQAIFERSVIPQCGGTPTVSAHLANKAYVDQEISLKAPKYYWLAQSGIPVGAWVSLNSLGVPVGARGVRIFVRLHTGQGPDNSFAKTRSVNLTTGAITTITGDRNIGWIAALGSSDNAGAQMVGELPCAGFIGKLDEDTQIFVNYANYGCFIDGYWK